MLDAIADFWKPVKKSPAIVKVKLDDVQLGSSLIFGFVPQATLSGKKLVVSRINTYQFGEDVLTSFVLSHEGETAASMIIAQADGEKYLAISRRMSMADRGKLFNQDDLDAVIRPSEFNLIHSKDGVTDYKGWVVASYKREIQGMKGKIYGGDYRKIPLAAASAPQEFAYTLLVSDSNEHALEIERYDDGRLEVYATVYRRLSDIAEIEAPSITETVKEPAPKEMVRADKKIESPMSLSGLSLAKTNGLQTPVFASKELSVVLSNKPEPKLETKPVLAPFSSPDIQLAKPQPMVEPTAKTPEQKLEPAPVPPTPVAATTKEVATPVAKEAANATPQKPEVTEPVREPLKPEVLEHVKTEPVKLPEFPADMVAKKQLFPDAYISAITIQPTSQPFIKQEIKAVNKDMTQFVNESIECELQVANKIIDEAIRNEMRINDVVRRVIGLPVSQQESVQIPVTLTDQDFSLLAIRYGLSATDRDAIKKRITEDLGDFSGANKQKKAA